MVAIITERLKRKLINELMVDVDAPNSQYYVAIGKSEQWDSADTVPTPTASDFTSDTFRLSMQSMKIGEDVSLVVPRYNWSSGTQYSRFDTSTVGHPTNPYYVITDENQVYVCLQVAKTAAGIHLPSTVQPTTTSATTPQQTSDGYVWKYLYTLGASNASKFLSTNFMPVEYINPATDSATLTALQREQREIQAKAVKGQLLGIEVTDGGSGYDSTGPTVVITGLQNRYDSAGGLSPSTATATASVFNGAITKINVNDYGRFYEAAKIEFSGGGGTGAAARAIVSTVGDDPRKNLGATAVMFNCKLTGDEGNTFQIENDYRQVALIRNPRTGPDSAPYSTPTINDPYYQQAPINQAQSSNCLRALKLATTSVAFTADKTIVGGTSGAQGYIDRVDSNRVYFHQNEQTGYGHFSSGEAVTEANGSGSGSLDSVGAGFLDSADVNIFTGEIMYIDNRASITRNLDQTEDIKVVIQF